MSYTLLFQAECAACSRAAQAVAGLGIEDLTVRGLSDPLIVAQLRQAGLEPPNRPALLIQQGTEVRLVTGWAMRRMLARHLGWRRAGQIAGLVSAEGFAHAARMGTISRRGFLGRGAAAAGAVSSMLLPGSPFGAIAQPATRGLIPVRPADLQAAMRSTEVQTAMGTWGAAEAAGAVNDATNPVLVLSFTSRPDVFLFVDNTPGVAASKRVAVALAANADGSMSYLGPDGTPYASLVNRAGTVTVVEAPSIRIPRAKLVCFYRCLKEHIGQLSQACVQACFNCAHSSGPSRLAPCIQCFLCAGHLGPTCANRCLR